MKHGFAAGHGENPWFSFEVPVSAALCHLGVLGSYHATVEHSRYPISY